MLSGFTHLALDGKVALVGNKKEDRFTLAFDPTFGAVLLSMDGKESLYLLDFAFPILMDLAANDWFRVTLGPRYRGNHFFASGAGVGTTLHFAGMGLGAEFVVNDTVVLQPHGTFDWPLNGLAKTTQFFTGGFAIKLRF